MQHQVVSSPEMPEMRLLYLIDSVDAPGGAEQALANLAPVYVKLGLELDVAYLVERVGLQEHLTRCGAEVFSLAGPGGRFGSIARSYNLIRQRRPDLVHTNLFEADIAGRMAGMLARVPVVSSLVNVHYGPEHRANPSVSNLRLRSAQAADSATAQTVRRFHAVTDHVATVMAHRLHISGRRIDVIPRGRDAERLGRRTPARRADVRRSLGLGMDQHAILAAARHEYQKGIDILLHAMPPVLERHRDTVLLVAGRRGNETPLLERIIAEKGLEPNVRFLGPREDVPDLLAAVDAFVLPSRWEGIAGVLLEAMALEAPIVAADLAPLHEVVDESTSVLVPPGNPASFGEAVARVLTETVASTDRARRARADFESRFAIDRVGERMLSFYERALAAPSLVRVPG
jgi:glycosyltransferase involved in cell wall biosynthesis